MEHYVNSPFFDSLMELFFFFTLYCTSRTAFVHYFHIGRAIFSPSGSLLMLVLHAPVAGGQLNECVWLKGKSIPWTLH